MFSWLLLSSLQDPNFVLDKFLVILQPSGTKINHVLTDGEITLPRNDI